MAIIETRELTREFRRRGSPAFRAVDAMTFDVEAGASIGYIGANGAGKSTTIKMLTGILVPSSGSVRTCGFDPVRQRIEVSRRIGVVFGQRSQLWWDLPTRESFTILAAIHRLPPTERDRRTTELIERLELGEFLDQPVRQLSLGQRMRAEVAAALLHRPELVILDEPTIGLDVVSKQRLREFLIGERTAYGTTLFLTTHDMGDIERLCERVLLVDRGRLAYDGTIGGLAAVAGLGRVLVVDLAEPTTDLLDLGMSGIRHLGSEAEGMRQRIAFDPARISAADLLSAVSARAVVRDLSIEEPDIEDVVRRVYGR